MSRDQRFVLRPPDSNEDIQGEIFAGDNLPGECLLRGFSGCTGFIALEASERAVVRLAFSHCRCSSGTHAFQFASAFRELCNSASHVLCAVIGENATLLLSALESKARAAGSPTRNATATNGDIAVSLLSRSIFAGRWDDTTCIPGFNKALTEIDITAHYSINPAPAAQMSSGSSLFLKEIPDLEILQNTIRWLVNKDYERSSLHAARINQLGRHVEEAIALMRRIEDEVKIQHLKELMPTDKNMLIYRQKKFALLMAAGAIWCRLLGKRFTNEEFNSELMHQFPLHRKGFLFLSRTADTIDLVNTWLRSVP